MARDRRRTKVLGVRFSLFFTRNPAYPSSHCSTATDCQHPGLWAAREKKLPSVGMQPPPITRAVCEFYGRPLTLICRILIQNEWVFYCEMNVKVVKWSIGFPFRPHCKAMSDGFDHRLTMSQKIPLTLTYVPFKLHFEASVDIVKKS